MFCAVGIIMLTSYSSAVAGVFPVVGVFTGELPVGLNMSWVTTDGSTQQQLAPVSINACT